MNMSVEQKDALSLLTWVIQQFQESQSSFYFICNPQDVNLITYCELNQKFRHTSELLGDLFNLFPEFFDLRIIQLLDSLIEESNNYACKEARLGSDFSDIFILKKPITFKTLKSQQLNFLYRLIKEGVV